jgi:hypothetical protein
VNRQRLNRTERPTQRLNRTERPTQRLNRTERPARCQVSSAQKIAALVKIDGRTEELQTQIAAATARRHELQAERVTARKEQIAQLRESFNQRAAQV